MGGWHPNLYWSCSLANVFLKRFHAILFLVMATSSITAFASNRVNELPLSYEDCFWPPDMVPHPHPPQPEPKDDGMAGRPR